MCGAQIGNQEQDKNRVKVTNFWDYCEEKIIGLFQVLRRVFFPRGDLPGVYTKE